MYQKTTRAHWWIWNTAGNKINTQKSLTFLYIRTTSCQKKKLRNQPIYHWIKNKISLNKPTEGDKRTILEKSEMLMKETKVTQRRDRYILLSDGRINAVKMIILLPKMGSSCSPLKSQHRPGWWGEHLLYFRCRWHGGRGDVCPMAKSLYWQSAGERFYRQRRGATCRNSTVSSDSHHEVGHWWSEQRRLVLGVVSVQFRGLFPFL